MHVQEARKAGEAIELEPLPSVFLEGTEVDSFSFVHRSPPIPAAISINRSRHGSFIR